MLLKLFFLELVNQNQNNTATASMSESLMDCWFAPVYADLNQQNTVNYQLTQNLSSLCKKQKIQKQILKQE